MGMNGRSVGLEVAELLLTGVWPIARHGMELGSAPPAGVVPDQSGSPLDVLSASTRDQPDHPLTRCKSSRLRCRMLWLDLRMQRHHEIRDAERPSAGSRVSGNPTSSLA